MPMLYIAYKRTTVLTGKMPESLTGSRTGTEEDQRGPVHQKQG